MDYPSDLSFLFYSPTRIVFGPGSARDVGAELEGLVARRALLVTDKNLRGHTDIVARVEKALGSSLVGVFDEVPADSDVEAVEAGAAFASSCGAESVVSVGGGSVIDTAKCIALLLREGGKLSDYEGIQMLSRRQSPHIVIPTTAGTGSEVTWAAVIKDRARHRKLLFADHHLIPDVAILDPELSLGLPPFLTAATGMDALSHAVEAFTSAQREPVADALALHAIALIAASLPAAVRDGSDLGARGAMLIAANLAGMAFSNAQIGLCHAIAHTLGARHGVQHGLANAIALSHVVRFNNGESAARHALVAQALGAETRGLSGEAAGLAAADAIDALRRAVGLVGSFREAGVPEADLPACAEEALSDGSIVYNARMVTEASEVLEVMRAAWAG